MTSSLILAIDQGTSSTKSVVIDERGRVVWSLNTPVSVMCKQPGWVEQDPNELLHSVESAIGRAWDEFGSRLLGVALSTQRESAVVWSRRTGEPLGPVIGWQDRRGSSDIDALRPHSDRVRSVTGLPLDPMFSATKIASLLDKCDPDRMLSARGDIAAGTIDSFLVASLEGSHRIEAGNASRTSLLNLEAQAWDDELLDLFGIPHAVLPEVVSSDLATSTSPRLPVPIVAILADSHAALFAHAATDPAAVKATYGTGSSIMGLASSSDADDASLASTLAWKLGTEPTFAFEGNILSSGSTVSWLARLLRRPVDEVWRLAERGRPLVELVPAFQGLAAPWWRNDAVATLTGFDLSTTAEDLARAAVDSIALQVEDVLAAADRRLARRIEGFFVDGGPTGNTWFMQSQANLSQRTVWRSTARELSALGVAKLGGWKLGIWDDPHGFQLSYDSILPASESASATRIKSWADAVARASFVPDREALPNLQISNESKGR